MSKARDLTSSGQWPGELSLLLILTRQYQEAISRQKMQAYVGRSPPPSSSTLESTRFVLTPLSVCPSLFNAILFFVCKEQAAYVERILKHRRPSMPSIHVLSEARPRKPRTMRDWVPCARAGLFSCHLLVDLVQIGLGFGVVWGGMGLHFNHT